jgi:4-hydroxybenzoate polyprenyltransferase
MTALQAGIGVVNDVVDAPADAVAKPAKPIPAGLVSRAAAMGLAAAAMLLGLGLSAGSGWGTVLIALAILAVGLAYDLRLKGTAWSWLPFAVGIPILPVYAWYGAVGTVPAEFGVLIPAAVAAGAALAIGNARADLERDAASGVASIATRLGQRAAWAWQVVLFVAIAVAAVVSVAAWGGGAGGVALVAAAGLVPVLAAAAARDAGPGGRERAWEVEAIGVAVLAVAWLWVALA